MSAIERTTPPGLPPGWRREVVIRKSGQSAGKYDVYYFSPDGKKFRSKPQIVRYLGESVDLNLFDFSGRTTSGQRRSAKERPPKISLHTMRGQERPLSSTPMRPAGPIRRTCGVIKLPVTYYPARPGVPLAQAVTTPTSNEPQVVLGSMVQQLWGKRLTVLRPVDSLSGETILATVGHLPPTAVIPQETLIVAPPTATDFNPTTAQSSSSSVVGGGALQMANSIAGGTGAVIRPLPIPVNQQYKGGQNVQVVSAPVASNNHYLAALATSTMIPGAAMAGLAMKSHIGGLSAATTTIDHHHRHLSAATIPVIPATMPQRHIAPSNNIVPLYKGPLTTRANLIPMQQQQPQQHHNQQGLIPHSGNILYMQLPQQSAGGGKLTVNSTGMVSKGQMMGAPQKMVPATAVTPAGLKHSAVTETDIILQEQKVKLLRQQLGLTS